MLTIPLYHNFTREEVKNDSSYMYLFTDNSNRTSGKHPIALDSTYTEIYGDGKMYPNTTQAVIRGLNNAFPVLTMATQFREQWSDNNIVEFKKAVDFDFEVIDRFSGFYDGIKYSAIQPFGAGSISNMRAFAPICFSYLSKKLLEIGIENK